MWILKTVSSKTFSVELEIEMFRNRIEKSMATWYVPAPEIFLKTFYGQYLGRLAKQQIVRHLDFRLVTWRSVTDSFFFLFPHTFVYTPVCTNVINELFLHRLVKLPDVEKLDTQSYKLKFRRSEGTWN